jgi:hypothetical protein
MRLKISLTLQPLTPLGPTFYQRDYASDEHRPDWRIQASRGEASL